MIAWRRASCRVIGVLAVLVATATDALAEGAPPDDSFAAAARAAPVDPAYGAYLATECLTCHPASGPAQGIPVIAGRPAASLIDLIAAYRSGVRHHPVMEMVAHSLDPAAAAAVSHYLASLSQP